MKKFLPFGLALIIFSVILIVYHFVYKPYSENDVSNGSEAVNVNVGYLPSLAASHLYVGIAKGYFEDEGLDVSISEIYSGPDIITALQSKSTDIAFGIVPPLIASRSKGLEILSIAGATVDGPKIKEHRLILPLNSTITKPEDLRGKKIAVVAEGTSDYFGLVGYLARHGIGINEVEVIPTPHPEMIVAVSSGRVDAAASIEPFITKAMLGGKAKVFDYYYPQNRETEIGTYLALNSYVEGNEETISKFVRAINKANDFISNEDSLRQLLPTLTEYGIKFKLSQEEASQVTIMEFRTSLSNKGVEDIMNEMLEFGSITVPIKPEDAILQPAP